MGVEPIPDHTVKLDRAIVLRDPSFPARLGRYHVTARIGLGGFATVYSALDPGLDAPVAIKVLAENHAADVEVRRRFVAEARVARRVGSERLVGVFDIGETDDGRPYVVMELADGGTLRSRINRLGGPARSDVLARLVEELGACLEVIHGRGVVHRDIKPTNLLLRSIGGGGGGPAGEGVAAGPGVLIGPGERLVLADFGLAREISAGASSLTVGGGTAGYMAPEQADPAGKADHRVDLYAATVVVAEVATARHPERLDLATAPIPAALREVLSAGMAVDRADRPASAEIWRHQLLAALAGEAATGLLTPEPDTRVFPAGPWLGAGAHEGRPADRTTAVEHRPRTDIQAPYPYNRDGFDDDLAGVVADTGEPGPADGSRDRPTLVPVDELQPRTFVQPPPEGATPPPPPSLPCGPGPRRPTPATDPWSSPPARGARQPAPSPLAHTPTPPPAAPPAPSPLITTPAPPPAAPPTPSPHVTAPAPPSAAPPSPWTQPLVTTPTPAPIPAPTYSPSPLGTAPLPASAQTMAPPPAAPARQPTAPPPARTAPVPAPATPVGGPVPVVAPPIGLPPGSPEAESRSREHLKTSQRLAKLEAREQRRTARRIRRRRRFVRVANLVRALIRAALGALTAFVAATVYLSLRLGVRPEAFGDRAQGAVRAAVLLGLLLGLVFFPWPRRLRQ